MKSTHFASVTEPKKVAEVLRVLDGYEGTLTVRCALHLGPLVFVRPGELRHAEWTDIDLDAAEWRYTVTKTDNQHLLPLSHQAVKILRELPERRKMMPQWVDYPGKLKAGAEVIPFPQRA